MYHGMTWKNVSDAVVIAFPGNLFCCRQTNHRRSSENEYLVP